MTTPTAIKNWNELRRIGKFRKWIEDGNKSGLFVVLDEAHHAPVHGFRHLLIGSDEAEPGIRTIAKRTNLLDLTATPTWYQPAGMMRESGGYGISPQLLICLESSSTRC